MELPATSQNYALAAWQTENHLLLDSADCALARSERRSAFRGDDADDDHDNDEDAGGACATWIE
jgi:hypothetical protein